MKNANTRLQTLFVVLSIMAILASSFGGYIYYATLTEFSVEQTHKEAAEQLNELGNDIDAYLSWHLLSVKSLAGIKELKHSLLSEDMATLDETNIILDHFREAFQVSVCYLMDHSGNTIASSNRNALDTFVGKNYGFRPYYTQSMQGIPAVYMALGVTSKERGIYYSNPVYNEAGQMPLGIAVIKAPVESIEKSFSKFKPGIVLLIDPNGVVFFSSRPYWLYNVLWKTSAETISSIEKTKQFGAGPWKWTGMKQTNKDSAVDELGNTYRLHQQELANYPDWRLVSLYSQKEIKDKIVAPLWKSVGPGLIILCVVFAGIVCFLFIKANTSILQRKKIEQDLKDSEERHRLLFRDSPDAYLIIVDGVVVECNRATEVMLRGDRTQIIGKRPEVVSPEFQPDGRKSSLAAEEKIRQALLTGSNAFEWVHRRLDGSDFFVDVSITSMMMDDKPALFTTWRDITKRKSDEKQKAKLEALSRQLQKNDSLHRMAGAIAHHFNNQLGAVMGNLEMALEDLPQDTTSVKSQLTAAMLGAQKAADVSGLMLAYLGQTPGRHIPLDLSMVCRESLPLLQAAAPKNLILETECPVPGPTICANKNQIQQILTNLATNAWEAVGESQGTVKLAVKTVSQTDIPATHRFPIDWQPQDSVYACLEISDTGCGIAIEDIDKLFDPFFSSKFTGRGLGLPVVLGNAKAHDGVVTVESKVGGGTILRAFFPVSAEEPSNIADKTPQSLSTEGGSTVLLVEDEKMLRDMVASMLMRMGYRVLTAKDGVEALEVFKDNLDKIKVVLSDLSMPRMDGWETLTALRQIRPDIPVVLASGHDESKVLAGDHPELPQVFLHKPYKKAVLKEAITRAMGG
ncbi:MAG: response regulator [Proteobacteria bacterium]|nr:response regulator [Pseudomonadota bacterium]